MKASQTRLVAGLFLILAGALFLLQNLRIIRLGGLGDLVIASLFVLGSLGFLAIFVSNRDHWWSLIPAGALFGIGGLIAMDQIAPRLASALGGSFFLGSLGLAFWLIFVTHRQHWWAIIPGGVLTTLAVVAGAGSLFRGDLGGVLFFLGLAATFGVLYVLPVADKAHTRWAIIPAVVCLILALVISASLTAVAGVIGPLALILLGLYLLIRPRRAIKTTVAAQKDNAQ
jgi:hypothetical protein